ncbi:hypothetical protein IGB42_01809 [Andreprevotia sp. IGB-42]|uniref:hypothetical protein n=1 Tax=Andreprevotia sp. IGB-42 TaxID=2497473 RepID=UPI0013577B4A|nr:hypothetical protein [Andreprevotia sp. IGB-42]KAF0813458.1 hypothetical protein IGB42_01809 [Andreprevotia sp. IGB-42]
MRKAITCLLLLPATAYASDMGGIGLLMLILELALLILIAALLAGLQEGKVAFFILLGLSVFASLQLGWMASISWQRSDDVLMLQIVMGQVAFLWLLTVWHYRKKCFK